MTLDIKKLSVSISFCQTSLQKNNLPQSEMAVIIILIYIYIYIYIYKSKTCSKDPGENHRVFSPGTIYSVKTYV